MTTLKILLISTPVGPLGSGLGGGVELTLANIAKALLARDHHVEAIAPAGSDSADLPLIPIDGELQPTAQSQGRHTPVIMPPNSVLANMWAQALQRAPQYDVLVNFAYDWLPFYLTPFLPSPVAHLVSMGSLTDAMDHVISHIADSHPHSIAVHSRAQADTFPFSDRCRVLGNGFDLSLYTFQAKATDALAWVGRIAPEKGLEDAIAAVEQTGTPLKIWGAIADPVYWQQIQDQYPNAPISYEGFLPTSALQQAMGACRGLIMTPKWVEAFGNVAIEALACGVPVIAYRRGGPAEIVQQGKTGWLVEPDSIQGLVEAIAKLDQICRHDCRRAAEVYYSLDAMGDRVEQWLHDVVYYERS
ncbi:MAG: glycosyltransferase family 4 protein [Synechococcales cyanobacterium T60_A2020_003]|nr:glycosyltransferase family 4 protein [Synechococcales cyanobacterium T60_A2020_003]